MACFRHAEAVIQAFVQTGVGVPAGKFRNLPDVSLFASDGWPHLPARSQRLSLLCGQLCPNLSCDFSNATYVTYEETGGTSASSPAMAGIMAMVLQKLGGTPQGLANPVLYELAAKEDLANCNTNSVVSGNNCVFYDITTERTPRYVSSIQSIVRLRHQVTPWLSNWL